MVASALSWMERIARACKSSSSEAIFTLLHSAASVASSMAVCNKPKATRTWRANTELGSLPAVAAPSGAMAATWARVLGGVLSDAQGKRGCAVLQRNISF